MPIPERVIVTTVMEFAGKQGLGYISPRAKVGNDQEWAGGDHCLKGNRGVVSRRGNGRWAKPRKYSLNQIYDHRRSWWPCLTMVPRNCEDQQMLSKLSSSRSLIGTDVGLLASSPGILSPPSIYVYCSLHTECSFPVCIEDLSFYGLNVTSPHILSCLIKITHSWFQCLYQELAK